MIAFWYSGCATDCLYYGSLTGKIPLDRWATVVEIVTSSGCGSVGRAVASNSRGPWFESNHRQKCILNIYCQLYWKDKNKEKEAGNGPFFERNCHLWQWKVNEEKERKKERKKEGKKERRKRNDVQQDRFSYLHFSGESWFSPKICFREEWKAETKFCSVFILSTLLLSFYRLLCFVGLYVCLRYFDFAVISCFLVDIFV